MSSSRDRIVDTALELFWFEGFERTALSEVCRRAEVNPGSLYYFFPTKESLLEAALDRLLESIDPALLTPAWEGVDDPIERVFALLNAYRRSLLATEFAYGCPIGSLSLEQRRPTEGVRTRVKANFDAWTAAVRGCLERARDRFRPGTDLDALATFVLTTMEGAVMLARAARDLEPFDQAVGSLKAYFELLCGSERAPPSSSIGLPEKET